MDLVQTIPERCRVCYTCVRECPAKAIRMTGGQATVMPERCIACGNCVMVCTRGAKQPKDTTDTVLALLAQDRPTVLAVAPSFPAEFPDIAPARMVGMMRALGFDLVVEVAFGADLVAERYRRLRLERPNERFIATTCPAVVGYVERYNPELVPNLAPIVSPMVATARALRQMRFGDPRAGDLSVVFCGPCFAKKVEAAGELGLMPGEIDAVLTFAELRALWRAHGITADDVADSEFDPPRPGLGALFPVARGSLEAARLSDDLLTGAVVAADGRVEFVEATKEFERGDLDTGLLELLCCNGCIMGPGMTDRAARFRRMARVTDYARNRMRARHPNTTGWMFELPREIDLSAQFATYDQRIPRPSEDQIRTLLERMGKHSPEDELNCGACGYHTCRRHAIAILKGLAEDEMCLPFTIERLHETVSQLARSHNELHTAQTQLMHSERLASMGQLAAGIAHEVNNPLGVVLMYAHILKEETPPDSPMLDDLTMIVEQADRCKKIVSGLLNFARQTKVALLATDMRRLVDQCARALAPRPGITFVTRHELTDEAPMAEVDADQIVQVIHNLASNAQDAMPHGGTLTFATAGDDESVRLSVQDTGIGIERDKLSRIFEPFFTTKQVGKGTGLGLSVTYGIIKMHRGDIRVESNADPAVGPTGTTFTVTLPRRGRQQ